MRGLGRGTRLARGGLHAEFLEHLDYMHDLVVEGPPRRRSLRSSSLPYCPVLDVLTPREPERGMLQDSLILGTGTAAHVALQNFATLGSPGARAWGCWKCPRCGHEWKREQFRPDACPTGCNDAPLYVEISYRLQIATGHSDMLVRYPHGWVLHEYKTCGVHPRTPHRGHLLQARTYCHMLRRQFGISASYAIIYYERKHFARKAFGPYDSRHGIQQISDWTSRGVEGFRAATRARRSPTRANFVEVARLRPCTDEDSWDEYMSRKYAFRKKPCELLGVCTGRSRDVVRVLEEMTR